MTTEISTVLSEGYTLLDGGVGEELSRRGMEEQHPSLGSANALLTDPDLVQAVHEDYLRAGADVITTNTYATPRERLEEAGLNDQVERVNRLAGELAERARETVGRDALIAGSLPPIRGSYRPDLVGTPEAIEPQYREQASLLAPYVDLFLCETMSTIQEAYAAAAGAASTDMPVLVSYTIADENVGDDSVRPLRSGESLDEAIEAVSDLPVDGVLLNCSFPESITATMSSLRALTDRPIGGYANAFTGIPEGWNEKTDPSPEGREDLGPEAYATHVRQWIDDGAQIVGGCCRVGPEHIERLRPLVDEAATVRK